MLNVAIAQLRSLSPRLPPRDGRAGAFAIACRHDRQPVCPQSRQARRQLPAADAAHLPGARRRRLSRARRPSSTAAQRFTYAELYARARRLASALAARGIGPGDTVSAMLANTPPMLEAHYGVPMTGAVLHAINTRLDAAVVAFQLDHAEAKVVICDREFAPVMREALAQAKVKPLVIDYDDRQFPQPGPAAVRDRLRGVPRRRRSGLPLAHAARRVGGDHAQLHLGHHRQSQGRRLQPPRRHPHVLRQPASRPTWAGIPSTCGRCRCSTATAGASPGRSRWWPARTCACAGCGPAPCTRPSPSTR